MIEKVKRTALEEREILQRRDDRLYRLKWQPETSPRRRELIGYAQRRVWELLQKNAPEAILEQQRLIWPDGLPAHP